MFKVEDWFNTPIDAAAEENTFLSTFVVLLNYSYHSTLMEETKTNFLLYN
jgi:hypothetical protein